MKKGLFAKPEIKWNLGFSWKSSEGKEDSSKTLGCNLHFSEIILEVVCSKLEVDKTSSRAEWEGASAIQVREGQDSNKGGGGGKTALCVSEWDSSGRAVAGVL